MVPLLSFAPSFLFPEPDTKFLCTLYALLSFDHIHSSFTSRSHREEMKQSHRGARKWCGMMMRESLTSDYCLLVVVVVVGVEIMGCHLMMG